MQKSAAFLVILLGMAVSANILACDSVHQDMTSTSTGTATVVATATPAPAPVK